MKFTVIQTAMEVLTNSDQRQKYDSHRQGRYSYPRASGVKGNPYADLSKNFPPPPRPPGFPQRPPMQKRQQTASTADKYAEYASYTKDASASSTSRRAGKADATWKAWEGMRPQNKASTQSTTAGASSRVPSGSRSASAPKPPPVPPRAPPVPQKQPEGAFGTSNRASRGYVPQSPSGDEPPVSNNNYFTTRIHSNVFPATSAAARNRRRAPSAAAPPPDAEDDDSMFADPRQSTPYQTQGGEKLNPWDASSNISRSRSTRETNRQTYHEEQDTPTAGTHQRSASNPDNADRSPPGAQNANGRPSSREDAGLAANHHGDFGFDGYDKGKRTSSLYAHRFPSSPTRGFENPQGAQHLSSHAGQSGYYWTQKSGLPTDLEELFLRKYQKSLSEDRRASRDRLNLFELNLQDAITRLSAQKYGLLVRSKTIDGNARSFNSTQHIPQHYSNANRAISNSNFDTQFSGDQPHRFSRNSTENINTKFVGEDEAFKWQFNAGSPAGENARPAMPRSKSGSRMGRSPTTSSQTQQTTFPEPTATGGISPQNASFNPEEWSEKIGPQVFEAPAVQRTSTSMSRSSRNSSRKPKPVRMTAGSAGLVDSDESSSGQEDPVKKTTLPTDMAGGEGAPSPNAMDIDPSATSTSTGGNGVRNIPVTPSRPEWRAGDVGGIKVDTSPEVPLQPVFTPTAGGSEDSEEFRTKLSDLRNVEPLAGRPSGLDSFGDLKTNLPFPSAASGSIPMRKAVPNKMHDMHLDLPLPPKPPNPPPALAVPGLKPSANIWKKYMDDFTNYMKEWHAYNAKYADHFKARMAEVKIKMSNPSWLYSRDSSGLEEYMFWVEQDREVRARWMELSDEHEMNVRLFAAHRDKMLK